METHRRLTTNQTAQTWFAPVVASQVLKTGKVAQNLTDDPPLTNEDQLLLESGQLTYAPLQGMLFVDSISADDIKQGRIGDCYFMAALSSVANSNPSFLRESIRLNVDGTYTVRFFKKGKPIYVKVDGDLPQNGGRPIYGSSADSGELWVSIMEKAYAKLNKGYHQINKGGYPEDALKTLTGISSKEKSITDTNPDILFSQLKKSLGKGCAVTASTYGSGKKYDKNGLVASHAYTVLRVYEKEGQKYVQLRNPWGFKEWQGNTADGVNDGTFSMTIEDFQKNCRKISMTKSAPKAEHPLVAMRLLAV